MHVQICPGVTPPLPHYFTWSGSKMFLDYSTSGFYPLLHPPFALFCSPLHPRSHMSPRSSACATEEREHSGTWTSHLFTISWTGVWLMRGLTSDWLWFTHLKYDWLWLAEGFGGGAMVWNLEETRDCWNSASKGTETARDRGLVTMTFLSNDPNGRLYPAVLFVYSVQNVFIIVLHTMYLQGQGSMCVHVRCVSLQSVWGQARTSYSAEHKRKK